LSTYASIEEEKEWQEKHENKKWHSRRSMRDEHGIKKESTRKPDHHFSPRTPTKVEEEREETGRRE
jgi:hypothetical protein